MYAGTDRQTGERVILEARPYAGPAADGSDAVARLRREHDVLRALSGLGIAPEVRGYFEAGGHHFLVEEYIEGVALNSCCSARYPLLTADPDPAQVAGYTAWALAVCAGIERVTRAMHERGVIFNDLHMFNIMVRPDDSVVLIDFEAASYLSEGRRVTVGNPGFAAPRDRTGFAIDAHSLACIRLAIFLPMTTVFALDRSKAAHIAAVIAELFGAPAAFLDEAVREIVGTASASGAKQGLDWGTTGRSDIPVLARSVVASATPGRADRLFPGDIEQFAVPGGGLGVAHGAAGVLYALAEAADLRIPEFEEWLFDRAARPVKGSRIGLYDGQAGVAWVLSRLGHTHIAVTLAGMCLDDRWELLGSDLYGGLAGFALAMLATGDAAAEPALAGAGLKAAEMVAGRATSQAAGRRGTGTAVHPALRAHGRSRVPRCRGAGHRRRPEKVRDRSQGCTAGRRGLAGAAVPRRGKRGHRHGHRQVLPHRQNGAFAEAGTAIRITARSVYYAQADLFSGRAGMILYLDGQGLDEQGLDAGAQIRRLGWHAIRYEGGIAFPGDQLLRLSMDLGTGTAGIMLSLAPGAELPFPGPAIAVPGEPSQGSRLVTVRR